ncbi:tRNA pseudouridine(38-40) synthase TruA [Chloroflexota bacterium]
MTAGRRFWARVQYDGTDFYGFQVQAHERTVQGEIEQSLLAVTEQEARVTGAGRTDRGVHARGQVVTFDVAWKHSLFDLQRALNARLATDVAVVGLGLAREGFHPRFSARSRRYRYTLLVQPWPSPLARRTVWHVIQKLDVERMIVASGLLLGTHDFASFGRPPVGTKTVRKVLTAEWERKPPFLAFEIEANAFLYRMVRSIVGTLVQVGSGKLSVDEFQAIMRSADRSQAKWTAPAHGLCLMRVNYTILEGVM